MAIQLKPELEALVQQDVEQGPYQSADEFLERAVQMLHEQEVWLREHRDEIAAKIEAGYASAERGDLLDPAEVRSHLNEHKKAWGDRNRP